MKALGTLLLIGIGLGTMALISFAARKIWGQAISQQTAVLMMLVILIGVAAISTSIAWPR